ncbi:ADP-forming succinate--CoA ligase subunit beta [Pasteurella atlantica]|uniref:ADP-forming succinate--CoA ligase subunit beta n=1 Tax=Pasteurellaceae TaxID=712 RepID=UPI0027512372|nr:ADP-forming succinate--CoA ligase subunit beta [Pasteurella atlantica]MDP8099418.1 ADP-forming succinate--CoA ligase subunit beta [Pasteurella atlantica]MDP8107536.1 ADP-forming succinate--CoA ligase subunit beta [Pasteurella atlantica]MDP8117195.1 ADP-forming succinate--CoA ligase subunit beta [Pasteurella atlantica]
MNLHEYQAKQLLAQYDIAIPKGIACQNLAQIKQALQHIQSSQWVLKCQVHTGGRGKAGGIKVVNNEADALTFANQKFGRQLVTYQTAPMGLPVHTIYVEENTAIEREIYISVVIDRSLQKIVFIASNEGGINIEEIAQVHPDLIYKTIIDPLGAMPYQGRELAFKLGLQGNQVKQFTQFFMQLVTLFKQKDLSLLEINPLAITQTGDLVCLDAKMIVDDNALYRQPELQQFNDPTQQDPREVIAESYQLNYVALKGNIGCVVNGAGLAMGTMDSIKAFGGYPANFLDVGGKITIERVTEAFKLILSDHNIKVILVNIFGGIVRCDLIAKGIIAAVNEIGIEIPVIVRLEGNNAEIAHHILSECHLNIISATNLTQATQLAVEVAEKNKEISNGNFNR